MMVNVNKEITNYKENFFRGLTKRQTFAMFGVVLVFIICYYINVTYVGGEIAMPIGYFFVALIGVIGFYKKDGVNGEELLLLVLRYMREPKEIDAQCEEFPTKLVENTKPGKKK